MINNLKRNELGAIGHHIEISANTFVLIKNLRKGNSFAPPSLKFEHRDSIFGCSNSKRILSSIFIWDCKNANNCMSILPDKIINIRSKQGLSNDGNVEVSCHD